jgi:hypothetical protein
MRIGKQWHLRVGLVLALATGLVLFAAWSSATSHGRAQHVRWDIQSLTGGAPPGPINPGGHASATAPDGDMITLTGSGTFVAPARGGRSGAVTGGGTWSTTGNGGASGSYTVTGLVSWVSAGPQAATPVFIDNIDEGTRTNGTAVLTIAFSDGTQGVLTIGCAGPGAPPGIFEGIATTKNYKTYYTVEDPVAGVDANRSLFHVR